MKILNILSDTNWSYEWRCVQIMSFVKVEQTGEIRKFLVTNSEAISSPNWYNVDDVMADFIVFPEKKIMKCFKKIYNSRSALGKSKLFS